MGLDYRPRDSATEETIEHFEIELDLRLPEVYTVATTTHGEIVMIMVYYALQPEVAGGFGRHAILDATVHPPVVEHLNYEFGWGVAR